jgi:hypothetical protein
VAVGSHNSLILVCIMVRLEFGISGWRWAIGDTHGRRWLDTIETEVTIVHQWIRAVYNIILMRNSFVLESRDMAGSRQVGGW